MDAAELALIELLDHLGRQAAHLKIPAPRKGDSVAGWCGMSGEAEAGLRAYLEKQYPAKKKEIARLPELAVSFEALVRSLVRG